MGRVFHGYPHHLAEVSHYTQSMFIKNDVHPQVSMTEIKITDS